MVSCQSRSNSRASARSSTSCPLRGTSVPIEMMRQVGPAEPGLRGASSVPGTTTLMRSRSTPKSAASRSAVDSLVTMTRASLASSRFSVPSSAVRSVSLKPVSSAVG